MEKFEVNILGCGSALPTGRRFTSSQVINLRDKLYMVDCGEGAQIQLRNMHLKFNRLNHIFISHLHGDHCFGLPGLISTLGMLGRTGELVIHAQPDAQKIFQPLLDYFCKDLVYSVRFDPVDPFRHALIYEDRTVRVYSIPLKHRVPTCGFLFEELPKARHLIKDMIDFYQIPIKELPLIKEGADYTTPEGGIISNSRLTRAAEPPKKYAYCSDTGYSEKIIPFIENIDLLYHEATFCEQDIARAKETFHSSARQAATIAKLANVKQLMLGHFSARYNDVGVLLDEAKAVFPNTIIAAENLTVQV